MAEISTTFSEMEVDAIARLGVALSDPVRQAVLMRLVEGPSYPSDLASLVGTSASNLSNHLACLRGCGLVAIEREGRRLRYELASPGLVDALRAVVDAVCGCEVDEAESA